MNFDYQTAADLSNRRPVSAEKASSFALAARFMYDHCEILISLITDLRREIALREGEIALLKSALLETESVGPCDGIQRGNTDLEWIDDDGHVWERK